jgi:hypothetical protein
MEAAVAGKSDHDARRRADATAAMAKSEEGVRARAQAEAEAARREEERKAETRARREAEAKRLAEAIALAKADADREAEAKRTADKAAQQREAAQKKALEEGKARAEAVAKREEELRIAAIEETRRNEEEAGRKAEAAAEATRLASIPDGDRRATFVRSIQQVLKRSRCYDGALTGRSEDAQEGLHAFVANAKQRGVSKPQRIDLAKASVGDFESWLRDADALKGALCAPKPEKAAPATTASSRPSGAGRPRRADSSEASAKPGGGDGERKVRCWNGRTSSSAIGCRNGTQ